MERSFSPGRGNAELFARGGARGRSMSFSCSLASAFLDLWSATAMPMHDVPQLVLAEEKAGGLSWTMFTSTGAHQGEL